MFKLPTSHSMSRNILWTKIILSFVLFATTLTSYSQQEQEEELITTLKENISASEGAEKLMWLDSLSKYIAYETSFEDDSILRLTCEYALKLDSFNIAIHHTSNLIHYQNNIIGNPEEGKALYLNFKKYLPKVSNLNAKTKYYYDAGNSFFYLKDFKNALALYDSVEICSDMANYEEYSGLALLGKGQVYTEMGDFGNASLLLQDAISFFQSIADTNQWIGARNSLVILYSKNSFFEEAKKERDEMIELSIQTNDYINLPVLYYNAAADQRKLKNHELRIDYLKKALDATSKSEYKDYFNPVMLNGIVLAYAEADSLEKAEEFLNLIYTDKENNTTGPYRTYYLEAIKEVELLKKNYDKSIEYGEEYLALMKEGQQYEEIEFGEYFLYKAYDASGNKAQALEHYKGYSTVHDSINNAQNVRVLSYYQTIYETEKRDLKIDAQESNIAFLQAKDKVKNQWLLFGSIISIVLFGFVWILRSRNFAKRKQKLQELFTQDILQTQERERARIAAELHDSVGQKLLMLKNSLLLNENEGKAEIDLVGETIKEVREMSHNLHPFQFEKLGLQNSLKNMMESFQKHSNVFYSEEIDIKDGIIDKEKEIYIFRMLQEGLANVEKHANATACNLSTEETKKHLIFRLKDNGKGFNPDSDNASEGLGMKTLQERAQFIGAELQIAAKPGKGTTLSIKMPKK